MPVFEASRDDEPLFYLGEHPVRFITLLVALHCAVMVAGVAFGYGRLVGMLAYGSTAVAHGEVWRLLTYAFVSGPSVWFLVEMLMLWYFGREVENGLGWKRFGILYGGLVLTGSLVMQAFSCNGVPRSLAGGQEVHFAVFAAFVAMYPGAQFFFGLAARWVFLGLLAISALQNASDHQVPRVVTLIASSALAIVMMRKSGFVEPLFGWGFSWSLPRGLPAKPRLRVVPDVRGSHGRAGPADGKPRKYDPEQEMDRLLEKISRKGIGSLTPSERSDLEQARKALLARGGGA